MSLSPKRAGSVLYSLGMFVVVSALAGVLVAGLFVPIAGMAGVSSKAAATELENLPAEFSTPAQPERTRVLLANGDLLANFYEQNRTYVPLAKISPVMRQAQIAIEDHRFYEHGALDVRGTVRAMVRNQTSDSVSQGGSSITQQYVKQVQVEKAQQAGDDEAVKKATEKSYARKIQELRYAIALEKKYSKDEILERYLNIAYYGEGAYGVQAAAQHYFRVDASKLNLAQSAMLAGLVQNPSYNPVQNPTAANDRRDVVVNRMLELQLITAKQATTAKKVKFDKSKVRITKKGCVGTKYPFLCDYVYKSLLLTPSLGKTTEERENVINRGGLTIQTEIDPKAQDKAQDAVSNMVDARDNVISTMVEIQPGTGLLVAMAQSKPVMGSNTKKGETYHNYPVSASMGGIEGFSAGSTFKAFTAAAALENGIPLTKRYNARSPMDFTGTTWKTCTGTHYQSEEYKPKNSTGTNGNMDMYKAAARSVNTYFLQLEKTIGLCDTMRMAQKVGVELANGKQFEDDPTYNEAPSFTLGIADVTPISMARAYATFAARGVRCDPIIIDTIKTKAGKELKPPSANCQRVISEDVADAVNSLLSGVMSSARSGTGTPARLADGRDQAGKTGTINSARAVWFAGYTPELAGVSMIAADKESKRYKNHPNRGISGQYLKYSGRVLNGSGGGDAGAGIWKPAMTAALRDVPATNFHKPPADLVRGKMATVPNFYNMSFAQAKDTLEEAGFTVEDQSRYSSSPQGTFLGYSAAPGQRRREFSVIYRTFSRGEDPAIARAREQARADARERAAEQRAAEEQKEKDDAAKKKAEEDKKKEDDDPKPPEGG